MAAVKGDQLDQVLGAGCDADAAACAFAVVDDGHAVHHRDGVEGTARHAGAEADAAVGAELVAAAHTGGRDAVGCAGVGVLLQRQLGCARAHDLCAHAHRLADLDAHHGADGPGGVAAADGAGVRLGIAGDDGLGQRRAARVAAAAAVGARQALEHLRDALVLLDGEDAGGDGQHHAEEEAEGGHDADGDENFDEHFHCLHLLRS